LGRRTPRHVDPYVTPTPQRDLRRDSAIKAPFQSAAVVSSQAPGRRHRDPVANPNTGQGAQYDESQFCKPSARDHAVALVFAPTSARRRTGRQLQAGKNPGRVPRWDRRRSACPGHLATKSRSTRGAGVGTRQHAAPCPQTTPRRAERDDIPAARDGTRRARRERTVGSAPRPAGSERASNPGRARKPSGPDCSRRPRWRLAPGARLRVRRLPWRTE